MDVSKTEPRVIYGAYRGLQVSRDGGQGWQPAHLLRLPFTLVETTVDGVVYAFMVGVGLLLRTEEPDLAWTVVSDAFGDRALIRLAVDPPLDATSMYLPRVREAPTRRIS